MSDDRIKEIDAEEMETLIEQGALLVDCREEEELDAGVIDGYVHWPLSQIEDYQNEVPDDKEIVIYCRSGRRSLKAADIISNWTDKNIYSLAGGYLGYSGE